MIKTFTDAQKRSGPQTFSFKNEFGSFTSVRIITPSKANQFLVETTVRKATENNTVRLQLKQRWLPADLYAHFIADLEKRL